MSLTQIKSILIKALFICLGIYYFGLTIKLPNWRWMEQKLDPYFGMMETGLPFFRPWLPIERFEWSLHQSNWYSDNLTYGVLAGWMFYVLYKNASSLLGFALLAAPLSLVLWYTANGGTLYDMTAAFSLAYLLVILRHGKRTDSYWVLAGIGLLMAMLDHSRPFAFQICILITIYGIYLYRAKFLLALAVFALLVAPFHINQLKKFETFELSTYGGNNLVEAFQGVIPFATDCYYLEMSKRLGTREGAICALENKRKILGEIKRNPKLILGVFTPERIQKVFFPELVWHATGLDPNAPKQVEIKYWFHIYLGFIYALALVSLLNPTERPYKLLLITIYGYIVLITFMANRLSETIRVLMPALTVLVILCQTFFHKRPDSQFSR